MQSTTGDDRTCLWRTYLICAFASAVISQPHRVPDRRERGFVDRRRLSVTHLHSEAVVLPDMLCSREWLVVRFRDPFAETVPDRVEVPPATHSTGE